MKVLSTDGLTKLIELIKSSFISVDDTVSTTTVTLAPVATSGSYNDLSNKPTIPAQTDVKINNTSITSSGVANIVTNTAYNSSSNKIATMSDIPSVDSALSSTSTNPVQNKVINTALSNKQANITGAATTITSNDLTESRALVSNASGKVAVSSITSTELGYLNGVTSNVQTQLNGKQASITGAATTITSSDLTASRALVSNASGKVAVSSATSTELGYLSGVTSNVQTQLNGKQASITGGASTITSSNLTASRALVSNSSGKVAVSSATSTELGYLSGVTSNIQTQLNGKQTTSNLVTSLSASSTDTQYPSAKCVYNALQNVDIDVDSALSSTSENPVQNKVINNALLLKADLDHAHTGYAPVNHTHEGMASDIQINGTSVISDGVANIITNTAYDESSNKIATMSDLDGKQSTLISGTNIKTINNTSLLGSGNISIPAVTESTVSGWGFTKNTGTVTSVNNVSPTNGNVSISIPSKISDLTDNTSTYPVDKADTLTGLTASITELNYTDGVTSAIQTQLDNKVATKPDGTNALISNNKISTTYIPDIILGQMLYAGTFVPSTAVATLSTNAKTKLGTSNNTITLTNNTTAITGYAANEGNYYICSADGTFASTSFVAGDWLISTGSGWKKIDNTDAVTGVKGNAESTYRTGNVNITADNVLPAQSGNSGKFLTTNGSASSWAALSSSNITTALGFTPYNATNPNGYTSNVGTVTKVNNTSPDSSGNVTLSIPTVDDELSTTSENPVQNQVIASALDGKLDKSGGNMTGNLSVNSVASITTNGYVIGTWLQTKSASINDNLTTVAMIDNSGWIYRQSKDTLLSGTVKSVNETAPDSDGNVTISIPSAVTESTVSGWGFTKNAGTITGIKLNGSSKGTSGVVDLGTVITAHQDISGKQDKITSTNKLSADLLSEGTTNKLVSATEKSTWNGKQNAITSTSKLSADLISDGTTNKTVTATEKSTWNNKLDSSAISDMATKTWVGQQGYTSNVGTVTKVNNTSPDSNGNVTISIPTAVTESTVSGWGFTKNAGTVTSVNNNSPDANGNVEISGVTVDQTYSASSQNAQSGVAINGANFIQNTATGTQSFSAGGTPTITTGSTNIGYGSQCSAGNYATALGHNANGRGSSAVAIGRAANASGSFAVALGYGATCSGGKSIQLGFGTNSTAISLSVGFQNVGNYQLLDGETGLIPRERIDTTTIQDVTTLTASASVAVALTKTCSLYKITPNASTTFTFTAPSGLSNVAYTFELCIDMSSTVYDLTFPNSVSWLDSTAPDFSTTGVYFLAFRTLDGGTTWYGNLQGKW